jgi:aminopeptidase
VDDDRVEEYARLLVGRCIGAEAGWQVLLAAPVTGRPLAEAISRELARRGAYVLPRLYFDVPLTLGLPWLLEAPEELLERLPPLERDVLDRVDAAVFVVGGSVTQLWGVPLDRVRHVRGQVSEYRRRGRAGEIPTVLCDFPDEGLAEDAGLPLEEFEDIVYAACLRDWDLEVAAMGPVRERLERASEARIVADGTDVTLGVAGRPALVDDGHLNMPGGEVFCCPIEDSAEGVILFSEFPQRGWGGLVEGARLVLRDGVVVDASAERGEDVLEAALETDGGSRRIGELGLGCNVGVTRHLRNVLYDEKMAGTAHLALGAGLPIAGGANRSALHWDLVKDLRRGGRLYFDGELVQEGGRWRL